MIRYSRVESGKVNVSVLIIVVLAFLFAGAAGFAVWSYIQYSDYKNNTDSKIELAVAVAKKEQSEQSEKEYRELEGEPNYSFVGPDDYGRVLFDYPKTWSVYEATDVSSGNGKYEVYFSRRIVPRISSTQQYALRVEIEENLYDNVLKRYESRIKRGDLSSSVFKVKGHTGTRIDGQISNDKRGSVVIFKIRDKTLLISTDSKIFEPEYNKLIQTIDFSE